MLLNRFDQTGIRYFAICNVITVFIVMKLPKGMLHRME